MMQGARAREDVRAAPQPRVPQRGAALAAGGHPPRVRPLHLAGMARGGGLPGQAPGGGVEGRLLRADSAGAGVHEQKAWKRYQV